MNTKRNGKTGAAPLGLAGVCKPLQRFWCHDCAATFTFPRPATAVGSQFAVDVVAEAVTSYVEGLGSYRTLARLYTQRLGREVSRTTLNRWVETAGAAAKTPWQVSKELAPPGWGGWLGVDGKYLRIGPRSTAVLMVAVDQTTADIVHAKVVRTESGDEFAELITEAVIAGYPLRGVVADLGPGAPHQSFPQAARSYFGNLPFQACRVHFDRRLDRILSTPKQTPRNPLNTELKTRIRSILYADTYHQATHRTTNSPPTKPAT